MSAAFQTRAGAAAKGLRRQAVVVAVLAILALLLAPVLAHKGGMISLTLFAVICACAALALSALLAFDAALFRVMASHADEEAGGRAVDAFLAQAGLKRVSSNAARTDDFTPTPNPSPQGGGEHMNADARFPSPLRGGVRGVCESLGSEREGVRFLADRIRGASRYAVLQLVAIALAWGALTVGFVTRGAA